MASKNSKNTHPKYIWLDGKFILWQKAQIHILTHTLHYGDGVFEGIRIYKTASGAPAIFRLPEHLKRLGHSAKILGAKLPFSSKQLTEAIKTLIRKNKITEGYIRPIGFFSGEKIGLAANDLKMRMSIIAIPFGKYLRQDGVSVKISKFRRIHPLSTNVRAKICGHYVNSILAHHEAAASGFDEALLLDWCGNVAEGPGENIFLVKNGVLQTPAVGGILPGITRDAVIKIARDLRLKVTEKIIKPAELWRADEAFFTGTAAEITPIAEIDNKKIGSGKLGPITGLLQKTYEDVARGRNKKYGKWLTHI